MEAKKKKVRNSQEQLTVDIVQLDAASTDLSNNQVMRLGKEHLAWRIRVTEMTTQKFWKEHVIPKRIEKPGQYIMWTV